MKHTKGKLRADIKSGCIISDKGFMICDVGFVNVDPVANAKEIVRRWNAFEEGGIVEELRDVIKDMLSGLAYLRDTKTEPYGFGIDRLEKTGKAALAKS